MTFEAALRLTEITLSLAILQRGAEHVLREPLLSAAQMAFATALIVGVAPLPALVTLWTTGLAQLWRFRGPYNGGADKMVLLGLSCLVVAHLLPNAAEVALGYLAVQLLLSYVVSGWVKLRNPDWRSGQALTEVFAISAYPVSKALRGWAAHGRLLRWASWTVIVFELVVPLGLFHPYLLAVMLTGAALFHLSNALVFGLNRFLWAWVAVFPALIWFQDRLFA